MGEFIPCRDEVREKEKKHKKNKKTRRNAGHTGTRVQQRRTHAAAPAPHQTAAQPASFTSAGVPSLLAVAREAALPLLLALFAAAGEEGDLARGPRAARALVEALALLVGRRVDVQRDGALAMARVEHAVCRNLVCRGGRAV